MLELPVPIINIPIPRNRGGKPRSFAQLQKIVRDFYNQGVREWYQRIYENRIAYPGRPQLNETRAQMTFIGDPPRHLANNPYVLSQSTDSVARARSERIKYRRPTPKYDIPIANRIGPLNTFSKGPGLGVPKPLNQDIPSMYNYDEELSTVRKVRFIENRKPTPRTRAAVRATELPAPRQSIHKR